MTMYAGKAVKGYLPAVERKQVSAFPYVVQGENFMLDLVGPYSAFGNRIRAYECLPAKSQRLSVGNRVLYFTDDAVLWWDPASALYVVQAEIEVDPLVPDWVWTLAFVGGVYYFVRLGSAVISFNPLTLTWGVLTDDVQEGVRFVADMGGRLVLAYDTILQWSAIDDGADMAPSTITGAGAQSLVIAGSGECIYMARVGNGLTSFLTDGVMRSELLTGVNPFRHYRMPESHIPLNCFCATHFDNDSVLMLAAEGLYVTNGVAFEAWEPLMAEYFTRTLFTQLSVSEIGTFRVDYFQAHRWLVISISMLDIPLEFSEAVIYYLGRGEWGRFNQAHTQFGLFSDPNIFNPLNFGFIDTEGYFRTFTELPSVEQSPQNWPDVFPVFGELDMPSRVENGISVMVDVLHLGTGPIDDRLPTTVGTYQFRQSAEILDPPSVSTLPDSTFNFQGITRFRSFSTLQDGTVTYDYVPTPMPTLPLNSYVQLGPFRIPSPDDADSIWLLQMLTVSTDDGDVITEVIEDWMQLSGSEDWQTSMLPDEDWLTGWGVPSNYEVRVTLTVDGYRVYQGQDNRVVPNVIDGSTQYFAQVGEGVYAYVQLLANVTNANFHYRMLELSGIPIAHRY